MYKAVEKDPSNQSSQLKWSAETGSLKKNSVPELAQAGLSYLACAKMQRKSITERPSIDQAVFELRATPQPIF
jgi:hypothetical protein